MELKRIFGPLLGIVLLAAAALAVWYSATRKSQADEDAATRVMIRVVTGSEKLNFLHDERLKKLFDKKGITLEVHKAGSREIATLPDLKTYDVAFPAGQPAAEKIRSTVGVKRVATAFSTPMAIASFAPIAEILAGAGIVRAEGGIYWVSDMGRLLELMAAGKRWRDLPGNSAFAVGKSVLVSTTNVSTSNSAAQFLALASYLFNDADVVTTYQQADKVALKVAPLFARQGFQEASSSGPFEDYLTIGMGKTPLVWIYEAQFVEQVLQHQLRPGMILLYPRPTLFTKHVMLALTDKGERFLEAMQDAAVLRIASDYGYRSDAAGGLDAIRDKAKAKGLQLPELVDLVDPPSYDLIERMIVNIENTRDSSASSTAGQPRLAAPRQDQVAPAPRIQKEKAP